jgi:hypothetical protein
MARRWFYSHNGSSLGPVSARQLKYLAATGGLQPEDLIWAEGTDPERATAAGQAMDFANLRRLAQEVQRRGTPARTPPTAPTAEEQLPGWTDEIDRLFRDPEQALGPVPDWLQPPRPPGTGELPEWLGALPTEGEPARPEGPAAPVAPAVPIAPPVAAPVAGGLLERMGIDPLTEQVVDWGKLKRWLEAQMRVRPGALAVPGESDPDPFQTARKQLAAWFSQEKNRERLARGDTESVRGDPLLHEFMSYFERYGADKQARLWEFVDFLIESRLRNPSG